MIRNPEIQFASADAIAAFQQEYLREEIAYLYENSPYYRRMFDHCGARPDDIRTQEDLRRLPVTTKTDLQLHPQDFICVPRSRIIDYVTTSGTLGDPVTFALTEEDLDRLAYNEAESFTTAGCTPEDVLQLMTTIDRRFMAGLAYFLGARKLRCGVIRVGNGIPELQWDTIRRIGPTGCIVVPSFLTNWSPMPRSTASTTAARRCAAQSASAKRCATPPSATTRWGPRLPSCGPNWSSSRPTLRPRCRPRSPSAGTTAAATCRPT